MTAFFDVTNNVSQDPKGSAKCSQEIRGCIPLMATSKFVYFLN
jgi:hypothetical protein